MVNVCTDRCTRYVGDKCCVVYTLFYVCKDLSKLSMGERCCVVYVLFYICKDSSKLCMRERERERNVERCMPCFKFVKIHVRAAWETGVSQIGYEISISLRRPMK